MFHKTVTFVLKYKTENVSGVFFVGFFLFSRLHTDMWHMQMFKNLSLAELQRIPSYFY